MSTLTFAKHQKRAKQVGWWLFFLICAFYSGYAFYMGMVELLFQLGFLAHAPERAVPLVFLIHAFTGGAVLLIGPLQFNRNLLKKLPVHRLLGRIYVVCIWLSSAAGLWSAILFDEGVLGKALLGVEAVLWFAATTLAFLHIRQGRVQVHREWMIRSFALSLFFVTFSFWVPGLTGSSLPREISYPLAVFLSWSLNLLIAEIYIRRTRIKRLALNTRKDA